MKIKFSADSTCDMSGELLSEYGVTTMPLIVSLGDEHYLDGIDITPQDIYSFVSKTNNLPKTAARSPEDYENFFKGMLSEGYDAVIHFNISSDVSGSHQNAKLGAANLKDVYVVDSKLLSTGTAILLMYAKRLYDTGLGAAEIANACEEKKYCVQTSFVVDTLEYLHKGGRCSGMQRFGANLLKLHPYIKMREGVLGIGGKYRGAMRAVITKYIEDLAMWFPDADCEVAFITHSGCSEDIVEAAKEAAGRLFGFKKLYVTIAGSTITSHCGKGTLGLLFLNNDVIKD